MEPSFGISTYYELNLFGLEIPITDTIISLGIISLLLIIFAFIVNRKSKKFKDVPDGFQNIVELIVETSDNFVKGTMGEKGKKFGSYFGTIFILVLICNIIGIFNLRPPTADYAMPLALAMLTFFMIHYYGIKSKGFGKYMKSFTEPMPLFTPLNVIGEIATPVSLSFRMFGNVLAGTIIMALFYDMIPYFLQIGIPPFLHAYFDIFSGFLQTLIFTMLSMVFIKGAME